MNLLYVGFNGDHSQTSGSGDPYNATDENGSWTWPPPQPARSLDVRAGFYSGGDVWASTGPNQVEYISTILKETAYQQRVCLGIGAPTHAGLASGDWGRGVVRCANALDADVDDGPAIHHDIGGASRLWAVANEKLAPFGSDVCGPGTGSDPGVCLYYFSPCTGPVGFPGCTLVWQRNVEDYIIGHATVISHPISHDAIVAYRTRNEKIRIVFYNAAGNVVGAPFDVRTSHYGQTAACESGGCGTGPGNGAVPKCNGGCDSDCSYQAGQGCARLVSKIHMTVKYDTASGRAYLYLGYDERCTNTDGTDGGLHLKSRLDVLDITNELDPRWRTTVPSSLCAVQSNDFAGTVSAIANTYSGGPDNVALFFYRQPSNGNPPEPDTCHTIYTGLRGTGLVPGNFTAFETIAGPFPTIVFPTARGMGDYTAAVRRGVTPYLYYPTWAQPVRTTFEDCLGCNVDQAGTIEQYNLAVFGVAVAP